MSRLVLKARLGEDVRIGQAVVTVIMRRHGKFALLIDAPPEVRVCRAGAVKREPRDVATGPCGGDGGGSNDDRIPVESFQSVHNREPVL